MVYFQKIQRAMKLTDIEDNLIYESDTATTDKELVEQAPRYLLKNADLSNMDLRGINLFHADLSEANLTDTDFTGADLQWARLPSKLKHTIFDGANLRGANFYDTGISNVSFKQAIATAADFSYSYIINCDFKDAKFEDVNFYGASIKMSNFENATLNTSKLSKSHLSSNNFTQASFELADLNQASLISNHFDYAVFDEADLRGTTLVHCTLNNANLENADFKNGYLHTISLNNANLHNANLQNITAQEVSFNRVDFQDANLTEASLVNCGLDDIKLNTNKVENLCITYNNTMLDVQDYQPWECKPLKLQDIQQPNQDLTNATKIALDVVIDDANKFLNKLSFENLKNAKDRFVTIISDNLNKNRLQDVVPSPPKEQNNERDSSSEIVM